MKRIITRYGLMSGLFITAWMVGSIAWCYTHSNFEGNMLLGYAAMLLAFSFIFVGVKNYRDQENGGYISFGKAFKIGLLITLIASTIYTAVWLVDYYLFVPDFMEKFTGYTLKQTAQEGASQAEMNEKAAEMANFKEMYKSPLLVVLITYAEVFPVGLIISLLCALLLKRKETADNLAVAN